MRKKHIYSISIIKEKLTLNFFKKLMK